METRVYGESAQIAEFPTKVHLHQNPSPRIRYGRHVQPLGLRTIEVSRARIEHLQEHVPGEKWKLWVHGKGRGVADESVQVLQTVYARIQASLALRPGPLQGSDPLFATTACYDHGGNVVTEAGKPPLHPRHSPDHYGGPPPRGREETRYCRA